MSVRFEEIDWQPTPIGEVSLRWRHDPIADAEVYEVKLGEQFLMSSLFTAAERKLADLGLAALSGDGFEVVVGGLGLGYTARAALRDRRVAELIVVEYLEPVIDWHRRELVPGATALMGDDRTRIVHGDFFALAADPAGFDPERPGREFDAVLLDIDHSPKNLLDPANAAFYTPEGSHAAARHLRPGGVFGLWSDDPPDEEVVTMLGDMYAEVQVHVIAFPNPYQDEESTNTVYVAVKGA